MQVTQCDRCGAIYTKSFIDEVGWRITKKSVIDVREFDFCMNCRESLEEWMKDGENNESCMEGASGG